MPVTITDLRVIHTAPEGIPLTVVRVETNQPGLYGLGCATFAYRCLTVGHLIETYLRPLLLGRDAEQIEELWQLMHQNGYWRCGPVENSAISGVDMALWDIKGKLAGMPLYQLFGGKVRQGVAVYRHVDGRDLEELLDRIRAYQEEGVTHLRCQMGGYGGGGFGPAPATAPEGAAEGVYLDGGRYVRETAALFRALRERLGEEVALIHDVHERLAPWDALRLARALEPWDLFYLEDPVPLEDLGWLRRLRQETAIPLAQGELFTGPHQWRQVIAERLVDYIRVHISAIGGITPARKLQLFAEQYGVRTAWHGPGDMSPLAHAANIHLDLAARNFGIQEWSGQRPPNGILQELKGPPGALADVFPGLLRCRNGYVYPNETPGLGVDLDEREAAKYPVDAAVTTWTQTRSRDGSLLAP